MVGSNQGGKAPNTCGIHNVAFFHKQIHICALYPVVKQGYNSELSQSVSIT